LTDKTDAVPPCGGSRQAIKAEIFIYVSVVAHYHPTKFSLNQFKLNLVGW